MNLYFTRKVLCLLAVVMSSVVVGSMAERSTKIHADSCSIFEDHQLKYPSLPDTVLNCSGDPIDLVTAFAKKAENALLEQAPQITEEQEENIGDTLHQVLEESLIFLAGSQEQLQLESILGKLVPFRKRELITYDIHLVDSEEINAFAISGGHIYITSSLMSFVESEGELAAIIGHEIGHVDQKHCVRKMQKLHLARHFLGKWGDKVTKLNALLTTPFGQVDEYECDRIGAYLSHKAGYDPRKGKEFFIRMKEQETYDPLQKMIRTHPFSAQREKCLEKYIQENLD